MQSISEHLAEKAAADGLKAGDPETERLVGMTVRHPDHGMGTICSCNVDDARGKPILVDFAEGGKHKYSWASAFAKLSIAKAPISSSAIDAAPNDADHFNISGETV